MMQLLVNLLWGYHVLALIFITGIKLSIETGFLQIKKFPQMIKTVFGISKQKHKIKDGQISSFQALSTALAGSIGTGNIVGIGLAISIGGAGAIFWMWISAFFGMMTVFAEVLLSTKYRKSGTVGAFAYIEQIGKGKILPFIYGTGCVLSSLAMGNMAQAKSVAVACEYFGIKPLYCAVVLGIIIFILTKKGISSLGKLTEKLVPFMTIIFFILSIIILFKCKANIPFAINEIFENAFSLKAGLGGGMFLAMKVGISRGVFTNEAGLGSSSMAFSNVDSKNPVQLAYLGIFQVFIDTIVMCSITGICILCATTERTGDYLVLIAFENALGNLGVIGMNICMALFAFATMTATSYYGKVGLAYISKNKLNNIFPYLFAIATFFGCILPVSEIFDICDAFNGLMAIPNLIALTLLSREFTNCTNKYL